MLFSKSADQAVMLNFLQCTLLKRDDSWHLLVVIHLFSWSGRSYNLTRCLLSRKRQERSRWSGSQVHGWAGLHGQPFIGLIRSINIEKNDDRRLSHESCPQQHCASVLYSSHLRTCRREVDLARPDVTLTCITRSAAIAE